MSLTIKNGARTGLVTIPSSKSDLHRLLILAALGDKGPVTIKKRGESDDISATVRCLNALGADIRMEETRITVRPISRFKPEKEIFLPCGESGTTLRFLLPLAGFFGYPVCFKREGRLPERPLSPFLELLGAHGMHFSEEGALLHAGGRLTGGMFRLPGDISSQFISALLLTLPLLPEDSVVRIDWPVESAGYIDMTEHCLEKAGIRLEKSELSHALPADAQKPDDPNLSVAWDPFYWIPGSQQPSLPSEITAEGGYSSAAFFLCAGALSPAGIAIRGLDPASRQGDKAIIDILVQMGAEFGAAEDLIAVRGEKLHGITINAAPIPDLIPPLAVAAACAEGNTLIRSVSRLRLKESDRIESTAAMLRALGIQVETKADAMLIYGGKIKGGHVETQNDHRIAMAAAVAACAADGPVSIDNEACVAKSYEGFWQDFAGLNLV